MPATARTGITRPDALGVTIAVGDTVIVTAWGAPVRLIDCGRRAVVTGFTAAGNVTLDSAASGWGHDPIARGRAVGPGYLTVARRDGAPGYEGNVVRDFSLPGVTAADVAAAIAAVTPTA